MKKSLANGSLMGSYTVLSQLGAGGMGEVYLAQDTKLGRKVALKVLSADFTKNKDRIYRFQQEARAASALNHPNIITIYEIDETNSTHYIATEFIEGLTLRERMMRGRLAPREVLDIAIQVASALAAAHTARIMHRDIKPENIMLRPDGYVKVLDFGLAKLTEVSPDSLSADPEAATSIDENTARKRMVETDPGTVLGTVSYMSPEQARGLHIDARTDIFSLGIVMYEMIAGRVPFDGSTISDVIVAILGKRPDPLARYSLEVPSELERIVSKALAKDREERYQTIKDMLIDMKRLKQRLEVEAEMEHSRRPEPLQETITSSGQQPATVANEQLTQSIHSSADAPTVKTTSSAEYIITEIKRHKKGAAFALVALLAVVAALAYFTRESKNIDSLAVMPFANSGSDQNARDLGSLLSQRIINNLSQLPGLKVMSFSSVARFVNQQIDPRAVGRDMEVRAVLMGSVIKNERDDSLSINVEIVNARDSSQIWGKQYDRKFADIKRVQEEILKDVSERLGLQLSDEQKRLREAEQLYQEGRNYWEKRTSQGLLKGIDSFQSVIDINPDYAPAYAGLADCYNMLAVYGVRAPREAFSKAKEAAERALAIDNRLAEAHTSLAFVQFRGEWDWEGAEREFKRAIRLDPDSAQAHQWYSLLLAAIGRHDEAEDVSRRVKELDPTSLIINAHFGFIYYMAHRYDDVIAVSQQTLDLDPNFFAARRYLGLAYTQKGMYQEAIAEYQKAIAASGNSVLMRAELGHTLAAAGRKDEARKVIDELKELAAQRYTSPYNIAIIYAGLGEKEQAFEWLEKAYEVRADFLVYLKTDSRLDLLHSDERFQNLARRLNLE